MIAKTRHRRLLLPALLAALHLPVLAAQQDRDGREQPVRELLEAARAERGFPGASAAFVTRDGSLGAVAVGFVDEQQEQPLTTGHKMFSGSIGKTYVAAAVLRLCGEGRLDLDAKVAGYLGEAEWYRGIPNHDTITLRMLLDHRSGIPEHVWKPAFHEAVQKDPDKEWTAAELLAFVAGDEPLFAAGEGWSYADTNYVVAGALIEKVTGKTWYEVLRQRLLEPLGLEQTCPSDRRDIPDLANGFASGIALHRGPTVTGGRYFVHPGFEWCGGGVCSTAADLARWGHALFAGDVIPEALRREQLRGVPAEALGARYGLGVMLRDTGLGPARGHTGIMVGYLSALMHYPEHGLTVAVQVNTDDVRRAGNPQRLADEIAGLLVAGKHD